MAILCWVLTLEPWCLVIGVWCFRASCAVIGVRVCCSGRRVRVLMRLCLSVTVPSVLPPLPFAQLHRMR